MPTSIEIDKISDSGPEDIQNEKEKDIKVFSEGRHPIQNVTSSTEGQEEIFQRRETVKYMVKVNNLPEETQEKLLDTHWEDQIELEELGIEIGLTKIKKIEEETIEEIKAQIKEGKVKPQKVKQDEDVTRKEKLLFISKYFDIKRQLEDIESLFCDSYFLIPSVKSRQTKCKRKIKKLVLENFSVLTKDEDNVTDGDKSKTLEEQKEKEKREELEIEIELKKIRKKEKKIIAEIKEESEKQKKKKKKKKIKPQKAKKDEVVKKEKKVFIRKYKEIKQELANIERNRDLRVFDKKLPQMCPVLRQLQRQLEAKLKRLIRENYTYIDATRKETSVENQRKLEEQNEKEKREQLEIEIELKKIRKNEKKIIAKIKEELKKKKKKNVKPQKAKKDEVVRKEKRSFIRKYKEIKQELANIERNRDLRVFDKKLPQMCPVLWQLQRQLKAKLERLIRENYAYIEATPKETSGENQRKLEEQIEKEKREQLEIEIELQKIRKNEEKTIAEIKEKLEKKKTKKKKVKPQKAKKDEVVRKEKRSFIRKYKKIKQELANLERIKDSRLCKKKWPQLCPVLWLRQKHLEAKLKKLILKNYAYIDDTHNETSLEYQRKLEEQKEKREESEIGIELKKRKNEKRTIAETKEKLKKNKKLKTQKAKKTTKC
ncbi:golgin subfamily A member 6-like protein 6 [Palaemon carinicauda]|uniref:golgin subfamily A member 6-like protein 6 n=1 Tax=Palaemon carinicauda TaxID=392227 RepID=UPI0035B63D02